MKFPPNLFIDKSIDFKRRIWYNKHKQCERSMFMCDTIYTINDIKKALHPVFVKHSVRKAVLFGSYVKGLADNQSDIDLFLDSGLKGLKFVGLVEDVRDVLDKDVDVFDKTHIIPNSKISLEILKDGVVIYEE